jgi:23S rRNA pseudouridine1911/1915/1917 synthase
MRVVVPEGLDGDRLDRVVARLGDMSRSQARGLIEGGRVSVDGVTVESARQSVSTGSQVDFPEPPPVPPLEAAPLDFAVAYEDTHLAVVDKPAGVVTHPGAGDTGTTLAAGVLYRWPATRGVGEEQRWGIVHRLDRDTSGLLVIALDHEAHAALRSMVRHHQVGREYLALVAGSPPAPTGTIEAPLSRDARRPTRRRVDPEGKQAVTHYRVEERLGSTSLLRVRLETGRTHQIRVHLASVGLPVVGDRVYGTSAGSPRQFLHSARISFTHPLTGDPIDVESPLPPDLAEVLAGLRQEKNVRPTS